MGWSRGNGSRIRQGRMHPVNPICPIGGLVAGEDYYVIKISDYEIQLSHDRIGNPQRDIFDGLVSVDDGAVNLGSGATGTTDSLHQFFGHTVDTLNDWIISPNHELETGQAVTYNAGDGTAIDGLTRWNDVLRDSPGRQYHSPGRFSRRRRRSCSGKSTSPPELFDVSITNLTLLQMFRPNSTELSGLSVYPRQDSWSQLDVTLELYDSFTNQHRQPAGQGHGLQGVSPGEWATVFFDQAIPVNPGSPYYLKFSVPVLGSLHDPYPDGQLFTIDGAPGKFQFRPRFSNLYNGLRLPRPPLAGLYRYWHASDPDHGFFCVSRRSGAIPGGGRCGCKHD